MVIVTTSSVKLQRLHVKVNASFITEATASFLCLILVLLSTSLHHIPENRSDAHELNCVYLPTFLILIFASAGISSSSSL